MSKSKISKAVAAEVEPVEETDVELEAIMDEAAGVVGAVESIVELRGAWSTAQRLEMDARAQNLGSLGLQYKDELATMERTLSDKIDAENDQFKARLEALAKRLEKYCE